jgi:hypothetical protein
VKVSSEDQLKMNKKQDFSFSEPGSGKRISKGGDPTKKEWTSKMRDRKNNWFFSLSFPPFSKI